MSEKWIVIRFEINEKQICAENMKIVWPSSTPPKSGRHKMAFRLKAVINKG